MQHTEFAKFEDDVIALTRFALIFIFHHLEAFPSNFKESQTGNGLNTLRHDSCGIQTLKNNTIVLTTGYRVLVKVLCVEILRSISRNRTRSGGQSIARHESEVVGSNSYVKIKRAKRAYSSLQIRGNTNPGTVKPPMEALLLYQHKAVQTDPVTGYADSGGDHNTKEPNSQLHCETLTLFAKQIAVPFARVVKVFVRISPAYIGARLPPREARAKTNAKNPGAVQASSTLPHKASTHARRKERPMVDLW